MRSRHEPPQKEVELRVLDAARKAGAPIPVAEIAGEEPDFTFNTASGHLGLELTELLPPATADGGISPVEQGTFYGDVVRFAEEEFRNKVGVPVRVGVAFGDGHGHTRQDKRKLIGALVQCVKNNLHRASDFVALYGSEVPEGFGNITITDCAGDWHCSQGAVITFESIRPQIASRISAKNALVANYRANLPSGAAVWLLLYSRPNVSRSVPVPHGIEQWRFRFEFERVLWFAMLENRVIEIHRAESPNEAVP